MCFVLGNLNLYRPGKSATENVPTPRSINLNEWSKISVSVAKSAETVTETSELDIDHLLVADDLDEVG